MLKKTVLALAVLSGAASAETLTCPVGGERFEAPAATACNGDSGFTMLLMPLGCPPAPLPQCPQNFLPIYRAFSADELPILKQYMQSESYESNVDFSPYYLAYIIEKYLNGPDKHLPARLLLRGLWQDPSLLSADPEYMVALGSELEANIPAAPDEAAMRLALLAFTRLLSGDPESGQVFMARAESQDVQSATAQAYLAAVRACFAESSQPHCNATAAIPPA